MIGFFKLNIKGKEYDLQNKQQDFVYKTIAYTELTGPGRVSADSLIFGANSDINVF